MYQEVEETQARRRQAERAIQLAMSSRWEDAVAANQAILEVFPNDTDSYNRLGKALMELKRYPSAKKAYKKALELDPANQIAKKNLERLQALGRSKGSKGEGSRVDPALFIEEMGKTALTVLERASPKILNKLTAGDRVELKRKSDELAACTVDGEVIGLVEPKLRSRILKLMEGGNEYAAAVTNLSDGACRIIIKETYQDPSQAGRPSFPTAIATEKLRPYTKGRLIRYDRAADDELADIDEAHEDDDGDEGAEESDWSDDSVVQEGHVSINDAVAAEEAANTEDEFEE